MVTTPHFGAETVLLNGKPLIVLHRGLLTLLSFVSEAMVASTLSVVEDPRRRLLRDPRDVISHAHIGLTYAYLWKPFALPALKEFLPDWCMERAVMLTSFGELFVLLHEFAHVVLGHLKSDEGTIRDELDIVRSEEFDADKLAIELCPPEFRPSLIWAGCNFLWLHGRFESVFSTSSVEHGVSEKRIQAIEHEFGHVFLAGDQTIRMMYEGLKHERPIFEQYTEIPIEKRISMFLDGMSPRRVAAYLPRYFARVSFDADGMANA